GAEEPAIKGVKDLLVLGVATSIDALSTGFAIAEYGLKDALLCAFIVGVVTFAVCIAGIFIGRKAGSRISGKASVLGGIILIAIGIEIFVKGMF
ncbi:MAG: manganese efflux pump, partial [Firmicutes bacterium]|nr:manganese efflux pump [Bacillota bacterium]